MFSYDEIESPSSKNRPPPCIAFLVDTSATQLYLNKNLIFKNKNQDILNIKDIVNNSYINEILDEFIFNFYTSDSKVLLLGSNKNKFYKLNEESINIFIENFRKLLQKNILTRYSKKSDNNKNFTNSSFNCLNNLVISLRECLGNFNWNYSRDVGFLSPTKKKKKSIILHHYLFLVTPLPNSCNNLMKFVENNEVYQSYYNNQQYLPENELSEEEEDPSVLKNKMDTLLDKFQNEFIKKTLWSSYISYKIGINWIDTNLKNKNDDKDTNELEYKSKTRYIEEKYIKESIETLLSVYGGNIINLYEISSESELLPFSSYISNYRTKSINSSLSVLLIDQGKERREKMILENEEKKFKKVLWSGYLTSQNKANICKIDIIPMIREQKKSLFKSMDSYKKTLKHDFLINKNHQEDIPIFSSKRKTFKILNLIDINILDSAWLLSNEYLCQISNNLEEIDELLYSLFLFKIVKLLKLGIIIEIYLNINDNVNPNNNIDEDVIDIDADDYKKYYGILIPLSECLGFIRILNDEATKEIQSYIRCSKKQHTNKNDHFLSKLTEEVIIYLIKLY
ncbi:hypothetical protein BCR32DRAFT_250928 [Anaeromyces robustus]|uniref:Uncharacterized protein n=1 Tax=Anaeromyces robustus TaxID=1754192 RepID=A0A1Y1VU56_9FUNG|nr:hypothetical protein BCR32DRAFT_250928 [Anaeromyces robustus]|eukprot:ORX64817.1 hypothetical protein BCR32DRAFT_250928 [Anaeromyces robustus]